MTTGILIVADDPKKRSHLQLLLRELAYSFHSCSTAAEAVEALRTHTYTHAIIERCLNGFNSVDLIYKLHKQQPTLRMMLVADDDPQKIDQSPIPNIVSDMIQGTIRSKEVMSRLMRFLEKTSPPTPATANPFELFRQQRSGLTNAPFQTDSPFKTTKSKPDASQPDSVQYQARYLVMKSPSSNRLVNAIWTHRNFTNAVIVNGEFGSEFELFAREIVHASGDILCSPIFLTHKEINEDTLALLNAQANLSEGPPTVAMVPAIQSLNKEQATALRDIIRKNQGNKRKHLRFVLTHELSEDPEPQMHATIMRDIFELAEADIPIAPLRERRSDIPFLILKILSDLSTLHPFIQTRGIEPNAIDYLQNHLWKGNFEQLVNVLRSASANCTHRLLSTQHLEPLLTSDLASFHFMESSADQSLLEV